MPALRRDLAALLLSSSIVGAGCGASVEPAASAGSATSPAAGERAAGGPAKEAGPTGQAPVEVSATDIALFKRSRVAVRLADGRLLAAGGAGETGSQIAELFDPKTEKWTAVGAMRAARADHAIVALADGRALVCGGSDSFKSPSPLPLSAPMTADCELFDPATAKFTPSAPMHAPRKRLTLTRLGDGRILAVGNPGSEIFDPKKGTWGKDLATAVPYAAHTATLLNDGRVLVVGVGGSPLHASAELFDPQTEKWSPTLAGMPAVMDHTATLMPDGSVLIAGGQVMFGAIPQPVPFASVFQPKAERWNVTGQPHATHWRHDALLMPNGDVVIAAGPNAETAEIYSHEVWKDVTPELATKLHLEQSPQAGAKKK